jgi:hypothetical protein
MRPLIACLLLLCTTALAAPKLDPAAKASLERPGIPANGLLCFLPKSAKIPKAVGQLTDMIGYAKAKNQPLIIYCPDPELGTRIITFAFTAVRPNALRGMRIICAVGAKNDSYIRPVIEATGANLHVEALP